MSNKCLLSIISNITNNKNELWKTVRRTSFQKPHCNPFQSPSSLSMRVSFCLSMLSIPCFRVLSGHFCFTQSGGGSHSLDFDKFCDTAPLKFDSPHVCRIELLWIASRSVHTSANLIFHFSNKNGKRTYYLSLSYLHISKYRKKEKKRKWSGKSIIFSFF